MVSDWWAANGSLEALIETVGWLIRNNIKDIDARNQSLTARLSASETDNAVLREALDLALAQIEKQFGKGYIMKLGQKTKLDIGAIPTGALSLDMALGIV